MFAPTTAMLIIAVDKFPHTKRGIRRTSYPLVPCRNSRASNQMLNQKHGGMINQKNLQYRPPARRNSRLSGRKHILARERRSLAAFAASERVISG